MSAECVHTLDVQMWFLSSVVPPTCRRRRSPIGIFNIGFSFHAASLITKKNSSTSDLCSGRHPCKMKAFKNLHSFTIKFSGRWLDVNKIWVDFLLSGRVSSTNLAVYNLRKFRMWDFSSLFSPAPSSIINNSRFYSIQAAVEQMCVKVTFSIIFIITFLCVRFFQCQVPWKRNPWLNKILFFFFSSQQQQLESKVVTRA